MIRSIALVLLALPLPSCVEPRDKDPRIVASEYYARDNPIGRYQMVAASGMEAVYVLDTRTGMVASCNTEIVRYQTWCSKPTQAGQGEGPPTYVRSVQ